MSQNKIYNIPARFRRVENLHILLWLLKDICWAMNLRAMGMFMIIPTLTVALLITWQTRHMLSELLHNLAVVFWITANCTWMIGEFYHIDESINGHIGLRHVAIIPFAIGLIILAYYYIILAPKKEFRDKMNSIGQEMVEKELEKNAPALENTQKIAS